MENPFSGLNQHLLHIKKGLSELIQEVQELKTLNANTNNEDRFIDKREAAKIAGVSVSTIDNWRRANKIIPYYFDSAVRFKYVEFMEFLANQKRA